MESIESQATLILQVEFEMYISDAPSVRTCGNFSYGFNGVFLKVIDQQIETSDSQSYDEGTFMEWPLIPPLDVLMEEGPQEIGRFELRVSTLAQLRSLSKMLGGKD